MTHRLSILVFCAGMLASTASHALFRCGNVFQDRPCDAGSAQKAAATLAAKPQAGSSAAAAPAAGAAVSPFAIECAKVGKSSLDISWKREAGQLREAQAANGSPEHRKLVGAVYDRRGSAPEVRAAIEAECIGERQRAADAAAAIAAIAAQGGLPTATTSPATGAGPAAAAATAAATAPALSAATGKTNDTAGRCTKLNHELASINQRARQGGSVATMEQINNERRALDRSISVAKC